MNITHYKIVIVSNMVENGLILTKKIYTAINNPTATFLSCIVLGERGIGKSSYCLKGIHAVFVEMGMSDNEAWRATLRCLHFKIKDVINFLSSAVKDKRLENVLFWDDVGIHASGSKYFLQMKMVDKLKGVMDAVRTSVKCVLMTTPTTKGLLGILKNYDAFQVKIYHSPRGGFYRIARGYKWSTIPSGKRLIYLKFEDRYNCYLPKWVYDLYMEKRRDALEDVLTKISDTIDE